MGESDWEHNPCRMNCHVENWCFREVTHFDQLSICMTQMLPARGNHPLLAGRTGLSFG